MSDNAQAIYVVQVYDTQEHTLQTQAFRTESGVKKCVLSVKEQLDEMGGWRYERSEVHPMSFDAFDESDEFDMEDSDNWDDTPRKISVDVLEVWLND